MTKSLFAVCLALSWTLSFAQQTANDQKKAQGKAAAEAALSRAGCGPSDVRFDVTTDKLQHPTAQPDAGKALVYVFDLDEANGPTTRVGLDGKWVGANQHQAYFFFPVDAGEHRLCAMENSNGISRLGAAFHFSAKAGKTYYFKTRESLSDNAIDLQMVNSAEGDFLISSNTLSTSQLKPASPPDRGGFQPEP